MYERFFGLDELPFQLTPDPRYLFLSSKHREALGHLVYGIREGAGFVCITGEIGAGKTTLLRALLREADESTKYAYILNPVLAGVELLQEINHELGVQTTGTRRELLAALNQALVDQKALGRRVVLVIDEAQALDGAILEQLRLLSNFETESAKLVQIVLVGQPELRDLLARPDLEQLNQRITVRWHLGRLDRGETAQYIAHRVRTAGQTRSLFTPGGIAAIHAYARGIPRLINVASHRALLVAYASDRARVNRFVVRRAIAELRRHVAPSRSGATRQAAWSAGAAAAAVAVAIGGVLLWQRGPGGRMVGAAATSSAGSTSAADAARAAGGSTSSATGETRSPAGAPAVGAAAAAGAGAAPDAESPPAAPPVPASLASAPDSGAPAAPPPVAAPPAAARAETAAHAGDGAVVAASGGTATAGAPPAAAAAGAGATSAPPGAPAKSDTPGDTAAGGDAVVEAAEPAADAERAMLFDALRQTTPGNSAYEATEALLHAWGVAALTPQEAARPTLDLQTIGRSRGLEYLSFSGNLNLLRVLDLPAILELAPDDGSASRFVAVSHLDDDTTRVAIGRSSVDVSPAVLADAWFGKAHLFWRDLDRLGGLLAVGSVNPKVKRLHELLRGVGVYSGPDSTVFSPDTEAAVLRFQRAKRLFADGKAGPLTMITLYQSVAADRVPRLGGETARSPRAAEARIGMGGGWN